MRPYFNTPRYKIQSLIFFCQHASGFEHSHVFRLYNIRGIAMAAVFRMPPVGT